MKISKSDMNNMIRVMNNASTLIRESSIKASDRNVARLLKLYANKLKKKSNGNRI